MIISKSKIIFFITVICLFISQYLFPKSVHLSWQKDEVAEIYILQISKTMDFVDIFQEMEVKETSIDVELPYSEIPYFIRVAGKSKGSTGEWSDIKKVAVLEKTDATNDTKKTTTSTGEITDSANYYYFLAVNYYFYGDEESSYKSYKKAQSYNDSNEKDYFGNISKSIVLKGEKFTYTEPKYYFLMSKIKNYIQQFWNKAINYYNMKEFDKSINYFVQYIKLNPFKKQAYYLLYEIYKNKGDQIKSSTYLKSYEYLKEFEEQSLGD